mmetsp:Transcript_14092/g.23386  ORF Transcript_14092/g.23386 Transcript_14092/m.23386 type:complete len:175 (-) Transcript_14092:541-1065(-)|eukprot:CAMPEP_0119314828 /NCGR_PEP_ID=MMETSP1333-20130426/34053_1 /TAXON_ID=418940 /ORGANISM="Scyphosphaera apsteinii, Strain RCC1455" /LENGTH=174 /DNA_ID=CAMNT_0007320027 /DNA_START=52 /DNA_END=576 /DNA_ORIENTATION=-
MAAEHLEQVMMQSLRQFRNTSSSSEGSFYEDFVGFFHAVDWTERWLHALGGFHIVVWILVICSRRSNEMQMVLLLAVLGMVYAAEWFNRLGAAHWQSFATQMYFDERGVFISAVFSVPLLTAAFYILVNALRSAMRLLVDVKKMQVRAEIKAKGRAERSTASAVAARAASKKEQ